MCSCLQGDETSRHLCKRLLDRFRCRRYFLFQNDFARFIQNTVERPTISQIHTDGLLLLLHNFITECLHSANLLHRRSPFCASSASFIGSVSHPAGRPAFSSHLINADSSTGRCNTIPCIDSTMLARENHPFGCARLKPSQASVPAGLTLASDFSFCFQCQAGSNLVLRRPIETTA